MSQHDLVIANADGATVRADLNLALAALGSNSSGDSAPSTTYAYQFWADTTNDILKQRNAANSAWINILRLSTGMPLYGGSDLSLPAAKNIVFEGTTDNAYETTLTAGDPTADRTATLPDMTGTVYLMARGSDIASASTINLTTATGDMVDVTGTTTITTVTLTDGWKRTVRFTGALTLTHGASLILPTSANITTAAGDVAVFRGYASSVVRCISYQRASGAALVGSASAVLQMHTSTDAGSTTTSTTLTNISAGAQGLTPLSASSTIVVECTLQGYIPNLASNNVLATFQLYDDTNSVLIGSPFVYGPVSGGGGVGSFGTVHLMCAVASTGTSARSWKVHAKTGNASVAASGTLQKWKFTEYA